MFDAKRAKRAIQFIELLKLTGDFNGQPNVLMEWNKKVISDVFGTLNNRGYRQYRTIYITTAKKNIKSQLMSDIACLQLFSKSEPNGQIVLGAGSHEQARMDVYEPLVEIIEQDDELLARLRIKDSMREIENKETGTILKVISSENYTKHGWNISLGGIDELHVLPNRGLYDVIEHGSGLARRQPMRIYTTTAGDDPDRVSIAWEVHEKAKNILKARAEGDKEHDDPTFYPVIFSYDGEDIYNEENWYKANPSLGVSIQIEDLRELAVKARLNKSDERLFRWLNLNQWVTTKLTTWLPLDLFDATEGDWSRTDLLGKECYMGGDFSATTDLSAICLVFPPQEGLDDWRVIWDCWIPQESMQERIRADHVPYDEWAAEGWIFATEGDSIDYLHIKQRILELRELYDVVELDADPSFATMLLQELMQEGMKVVEIKQTYQEQTAPMNHLEVLLRQRRTVILPNGEAVELPQLTHEAHPVARWCFGNASIHKNGNSQIKLVKEHRGKAVVRSKRIDLTTAWVLAMTRAMLYEKIKSVYEKRGVRRLGEKQDE